MVTAVVMPQLGLEVTEGVVVALPVEVGVQVVKDDPVVELSTDKADTDVVAPRDGFVRRIEVAIGETVEVGATLVLLADSLDEPLEGESDPKSPGARVGAARAPEPAALEELSPLRRAIARRMTISQAIPQYALARDVDATWLLAAKAELARLDGAPGLGDMLVQALAETVVRHPALATSFVPGDGDDPPRLARRAGVNVGLAVATDRGLVVPVIRDAHELTLAAVARERARLVASARAGDLGLEDMADGTISLSNLGSFGVDRFTAMVNPGESAIVAVGRTVERLVPREQGSVAVPMLTVTMTLDHRAIDGAVGGRALTELAELLEGGMSWRT
ncbi:MAG: pyruvate dehydrogenase complex, component, dihydrolipoamide acetyltransferase [Solirubrobacterales bacterium]|nr:pyruvate dehydrogenase complex, component, dihydrolipoamide acetyltransferase [Solirubrobacterales bacterium]